MRPCWGGRYKWGIMPADDAIKPAVVAALVKDGWTITDDPLRLKYRDIAVGVDLGAERLLAASAGSSGSRWR